MTSPAIHGILVADCTGDVRVHHDRLRSLLPRVDPDNPPQETSQLVRKPRTFNSVSQALAVAIEEEYSGEGFFAALIPLQADPRKAGLIQKLANVERLTGDALSVMATRCGITCRPASEMRAEGAVEAQDWFGLTWDDMLGLMSRDYPSYVEEFAMIARSEYPEVRAMGELLVEHEQALIEFASREGMGRQDSAAPLDAYLDRLARHESGEADASSSR